MRSFFTLLVIVLLLLSVLTGCVPGANQCKETASEHGGVAGFWLGLWQGFIAPFVFVASLFKSNLSIYEVHNNGAWYNFGYLFGLACFFGGGSNRTARRRWKSGKVGGVTSRLSEIPPNEIRRADTENVIYPKCSAIFTPVKKAS